MKNLFKLSFIMCLSGLGFALTAHAQDSDSGWYMGASYTHWKLNYDVKNGEGDSPKKYGATVTLGYDLNENWAIEARANSMKHEQQYTKYWIKASTPVAIYSKYRYQLARGFTPYFVVGSALSKFDYKTTDGLNEVSKTGMNLSGGVGVEVKITPELNMTVEYTYLGKGKHTINDYDVKYHAANVSAGLLYKF